MKDQKLNVNVQPNEECTALKHIHSTIRRLHTITFDTCQWIKEAHVFLMW